MQDSDREVLQICSYPVVGSPDAPPGVFVAHDIEKRPRRTVHRADTPAEMEEVHQAIAGRLSVLNNLLEAGARESTVFRDIARGAVFTVVGLIAPAA